MSDNPTVVVAMSGGVDSSVAAALLVNQGFRVIGMMMRLWSETGSEESNRCCTPDSMAQARRVAALLDIPFYAVDAQTIFHSKVVTSFIDGYAQGVTPNPCLVCNRHIRWGFLISQALALGADLMTTGHYAQVKKDSAGVYQLLRAADLSKDQSYVLHVLGQRQLQHTMFPLGKYRKVDVRQMAHTFGLPVAERADSQDLCFLGNGDYRSFLRRNAPEVQLAGSIQSQDGVTIGRHNGLADFTIGQRKGLGISAPSPLYVLEKDQANNTLIVGPKDSLGKSEFKVFNTNWVSGRTPEQPITALVKIRYKANEVRGVVTPLQDGIANVQLDSPLIDITPGQAAVFYDGQICLGGGIIQRNHP